jgi:tetratricopeptide (TPR) repeat protein
VAAVLIAVLVFGVGVLLRVVGLATAANVTQIASLAPVVAGLVNWSRGHRPARAPGAGHAGAPGSGGNVTGAHQAMGPAGEVLSSREVRPAGQEPTLGGGTPGTLPARGSRAVPRQLPAAVRHFAGREAELAALAGQLADGDAAGTVVISAVGGTAGIGKTALAVYFAHQVAGQFPDGQLYVNLRGFDPAGSPVTPAEAVRGFLEAFEVPAERIPVSPGAQAALYRSLLAGRRVLVVLDNARDAGQVRPLLPGAPGCMVVVTSRSQLVSLITAEGASPVTLDLLTAAEARQLLARRLGADRVAAEAPAVEQIITSCARLPLALAIVAARAATNPRFPLASLASELRGARESLHALHGGEAAADARAVFSWSYQQLSPAAARLFRLLGLHPGPDATACAAASLAALPVDEARGLLAELARAHLVTERSPGRFTFHDLLRAYATGQARAQDTADDQQAAISRALDHYLHTAHAASLRLHPRLVPLTLPIPPPGVLPEEQPDGDAAWAWFDAEHPVLLAAIDQAAATGRDAHAWQLAWTLLDYLDRQGRWDDLAAIQRTALNAARRHNDRPGQAHAHAGIGVACRWLGRYDEAYAHLQQALTLFAELGDTTGQGQVHTVLGGVLEYQNRFTDALWHNRQALALFCTAGDRRGQAKALNNIGWHHSLLGDHQEALAHCAQALALSREVGDRRVEAYILDSLGYAHHHLGDYKQATDYYRRSLARYEEYRNRYNMASVLDHLGDALDAAGDHPAARTAWQQALAILDHLGPVLALGPGPGYPDASQIRAKLARHNE